jgi:hypothetical protein
MKLVKFVMGSKFLELKPLPSNWVNQLPTQHWYLQLLFGTKSFSKGLANEKEKILWIFAKFCLKYYSQFMKSCLLSQSLGYH